MRRPIWEGVGDHPPERTTNDEAFERFQERVRRSARVHIEADPYFRVAEEIERQRRGRG